MTTGFSSDILRADAQRRIVILVLVVLWLLVFEGALRKWFLPALSKPLLFLKDPLVLIIYYLALRNRVINLDSVFLRIGISLSVLSALFGLAQVFGLGLPLPVAVYGWRQYWLIMPLAFVIADNFKGRDLLRVVHHSMMMAVVNAIIVVLQSRSPPSAWINQSVAQDAAIFVYGEESIPRATGTFSFTFGHELFTASVVPLLLTVWLVEPSHRHFPRGMIWIYTAAVVVNVLLDGNRAIFLFVAVSLAVSALGFRYLKSARLRNRALILPLISTVLGGIVYVTFFQTEFRNMSGRIAGSRDSYQVSDRLTAQLNEAAIVLGKTSILGEGLGLGSGGGQSMAAGSKVSVVTYEGEWPRVIAETGWLGLLYLLYRLVLGVYVVVVTVAATKRSANMLPVLLASFVWQILPFSQMSGNATCVYYGWMFTGFALAASRIRSGPAPAGETPL